MLVLALTCAVVWHPSSSPSCYWHAGHDLGLKRVRPMWTNIGDPLLAIDPHKSHLLKGYHCLFHLEKRERQPICNMYWRRLKPVYFIFFCVSGLDSHLHPQQWNVVPWSCLEPWSQPPCLCRWGWASPGCSGSCILWVHRRMGWSTGSRGQKTHVARVRVTWYLD